MLSQPLNKEADREKEKVLLNQILMVRMYVYMYMYSYIITVYIP